MAFSVRSSPIEAFALTLRTITQVAVVTVVLASSGCGTTHGTLKTPLGETPSFAASPATPSHDALSPASDYARAVETNRPVSNASAASDLVTDQAGVFWQSAQQPDHAHVSAVRHDMPSEPLPDVRTTDDEPIEQLPTAPAVHDPNHVVAFDLPEILAMIAIDNPQVGIAGERYREAYARYGAARSLWLPSIRAGVSYNKHEGSLQAVDGTMSDISRSAMNAGLGTQSIAAGSPVVPGVFANFHLRDAMFQPKIASHRVQANLEASRTVGNDLSLQGALAYLDLLRAKQQRAIAEETVAHAESLAKMTADFARVGQGLQADADRAKTELAIRRNDVHRADEAIDIASARLTELLSLDPNLKVEVREPTVVPIDLTDADMETGALLAMGLSNRPELAEARELVGEAVHRYEREKYAPFLPSVLLGVSYSGFGGSDGGDIDRFTDRFDLDGVAFWELRNFGFGERAARQEMHARYQQEQLREITLMDQIAREIVQAHAQVRSRRLQIKQAEIAVEAAAGSYQKNVDRIRESEGLPLEALQSIQALDLARREYLRVVSDYNEAQFRLHRALGWPG